MGADHILFYVNHPVLIIPLRYLLLFPLLPPNTSLALLKPAFWMSHMGMECYLLSVYFGRVQNTRGVDGANANGILKYYE